MKIVIDAMGGDFAPEEIVKGAVEGAKSVGIKAILVGDETKISAELAKYEGSSEVAEIKHASQIIHMDEPPISAIRQKDDSSMVRATELLKDGQASALVTAGNSGAAVALAIMKLGKIKGVRRPALATIMPNLKGKAIVIDVGANVDCAPAELLEFAGMGAIYAEKALGISNPKIGLLNIGEEKTKGNKLTRSAYKLLESSNLNFIGNIEGKEIFRGEVDVAVCDGFIGNVALKIGEAVAELALSVFGRELSRAGLLKEEILERVKGTMDYAEYGGAPLLGVNGVYVISHGRSNSKAIKNAIRVAKNSVEHNIVESIKEMKFSRW